MKIEIYKSNLCIGSAINIDVHEEMSFNYIDFHYDVYNPMMRIYGELFGVCWHREGIVTPPPDSGFTYEIEFSDKHINAKDYTTTYIVGVVFETTKFKSNKISTIRWEAEDIKSCHYSAEDRFEWLLA